LDILGKKIIIFGFGEYQNLLEEILPYEIKISYYIDNNINKQGKIYKGKRIFEPEYIKTEDPSEILVIISSLIHYDEMSQQLIEFGLIEHINFTSSHAVSMELLAKDSNLKVLHADRVKKLYNLDFDMELDFLPIMGKIMMYTMTNATRMYNLYKAVEYIVNNQIDGDIVECGVWKGGSCMVVAHSLLSFGEDNRKIYMYDTFGEGFIEDKNKIDTRLQGFQEPSNNQIGKDFNFMGHVRLATEQEVKQNLVSTKYPIDNIITVKGRVQDTIPDVIPDKIALLRLDTDWFESTYHELNYLYNRISKNGILIVDDYGYSRGSMSAVNRYFEENNIQMLLTKMDSYARIGIKI